MGWAGHLAHMGEMRNAYKILLENLKEINHLGDVDTDRKTILKWTLKKYDVGTWSGRLFCLRTGLNGRLL
jgi:hypothetical protein